MRIKTSRVGKWICLVTVILCLVIFLGGCAGRQPRMDYAEYRNEKSGIAVIILDDTRLRVEIDGESYSGEYRSTNNKESRNEYIVVMDSEGGSLIDGVDGVWPMNTTFTYDPDPEGIRNFLQFRGLVYGEGGLTSFLQVQ